MPSAISVRRLDRSRSSVLVLVTTRETSTAPSTKQTAFVANGSAMPTANRKAPIGGATSWFVSRNAPCMPRVGDAEVLASHHARQERAAGRVGEGLGRAEDEQRDQDDGDADGPAHDRGDEDDQHDGPTEVDDDDHAPPVEAVRGGAAEDAEQQDRQVLAQDRHRDQERVAGLRGDEQRAGGEHDAVADVVDDRRPTGASGSSVRASSARWSRSAGRAVSAPAAG